MKQLLKILKTIILTLALLGIYDLMTSYNPDAIGRYQFHDIYYGILIRKIVDLLSLFTLLILIMRVWIKKQLNTIILSFSILYCVFIINDCRIWLWNLDFNPIYYVPLIIHGLSIIIILSEIIIYYKVEPVKVIITGILVFVAGFLFAALWQQVPKQEAEPEIYDQALLTEQMKRSIYYGGIIILMSGIANFMNDHYEKYIISKENNTPFKQT